MYVYVLYVVIVLAIGYILMMYFSKNRLFQTAQLENYINSSSFASIDKILQNENAKNNFAQIKNKIIAFYMIRDELYDELKTLQKRLLKICNLLNNNSNDNLIKRNRLLKFRYFESKSFQIFDNYSSLSEEILKNNDVLKYFKDLDDLTIMLRYIKEIMVENNIKVLDEITKDFIVDSKAINNEHRRLIFKLFEINNECVKSLRTLNNVASMQGTIAALPIHLMYIKCIIIKELLGKWHNKISLILSSYLATTK